jgi:hypothetical protein
MKQQNPNEMIKALSDMEAREGAKKVMCTFLEQP